MIVFNDNFIQISIIHEKSQIIIRLFDEQN